MCPPNKTSAASAAASGAAEMGDGEADVEASDTEHEPGESDAVAREDAESGGGNAEMVLMSVSGADQAPVDEPVPMSVGGASPPTGGIRGYDHSMSRSRTEYSLFR